MGPQTVQRFSHVDPFPQQPPDFIHCYQGFWAVTRVGHMDRQGLTLRWARILANKRCSCPLAHKMDLEVVRYSNHKRPTRICICLSAKEQTARMVTHHMQVEAHTISKASRNPRCFNFVQALILQYSAVGGFPMRETQTSRGISDYFTHGQLVKSNTMLEYPSWTSIQCSIIELPGTHVQKPRTGYQKHTWVLNCWSNTTIKVCWCISAHSCLLCWLYRLSANFIPSHQRVPPGNLT